MPWNTRCCAALIAAGSTLTLAMLPAAAQEYAAGELPRITVHALPAPDEGASSATGLADAAPAEIPTDAALSEALAVDAADFAARQQSKTVRLPEAQTSADPNWSRSDRPDGSASITVKKPLSGWDAKVGADFALPPAAVTNFTTAKPLPGAVNKDPGSGAAWANVDVPDIATIQVRAEPSPEQGKVGAVLQRSVPVGENLSVTLQNGVSVTETFAAAEPVSQAASAASGATPRVWGSEQVVKINFINSGTTFSAGTNQATNDPFLHSKFSAQQQIYGPLSVTTAVTDPGQATSAKSITAGVHLKW
jgi:hypothetical protein